MQVTNRRRRADSYAIYNTPICWNLSDLYSPGTIGYFGRRQATSGELAVKYMHDAPPHGGKIAYLPGPANSSIVQTYSEAIMESLKQYPNLDLVETISGNWNGADGLKATQHLLSAHPDINDIFCGDVPTLSSAIKWLVSTGKAR